MISSFETLTEPSQLLLKVYHGVLVIVTVIIIVAVPICGDKC